MEDSEDETDDGGEEKQPNGVVKFLLRPVPPIPAVLRYLVGDESERCDVHDDPEDEEAEVEFLPSDGEESSRSV